VCVCVCAVYTSVCMLCGCVRAHDLLMRHTLLTNTTKKEATGIMSCSTLSLVRKYILEIHVYTCINACVYTRRARARRHIKSTPQRLPRYENGMLPRYNTNAHRTAYAIKQPRDCVHVYLLHLCSPSYYHSVFPSSGLFRGHYVTLNL
jgi:hypothetical protein